MFCFELDRFGIKQGLLIRPPVGTTIYRHHLRLGDNPRVLVPLCTEMNIALGVYNRDLERATEGLHQGTFPGITREKAMEVAIEVMEGWRVDELFFDGEELLRGPQNTRKGGEALVHLNLTGSSVEVRADEVGPDGKYLPLEDAKGVEVLYSAYEPTEFHALLTMSPKSVIRLRRPEAVNGWEEIQLYWTGWQLKKLPPGVRLSNPPGKLSIRPASAA